MLVQLKLPLFIKLVLMLPLVRAQDLSFQINETGHAPFEANFDVDTSGTFITVWSDYRNSIDYGGKEDGGAIYVQKFNLEKKIWGDNYRIDNVNSGVSNTHPDICINHDNGEYLIVWQQRYNHENQRKSRIVASVTSSL